MEQRLLRLGIALEVFSILWMVVEAAIGIGAGWQARSLSLEAFGVDSLLELVSAGVVLWALLLASRGGDAGRLHDRQELAERIVGCGLLLLAIYVVAGALTELIGRNRPQASTAGLALAVAAVIVMPVLYRLKLRNARATGNGAMRGDAYESLGCAWMAAALLVGLALRSWLGWWWADPVAALALSVLLVREGWEGIHEWFAQPEARSAAEG